MALRSAAGSAGGGTAADITVGTTTITGGTTTRLLYDNGGTVGETAAVTYASASVTLGLSSLAVLGFMSSASAVDVAITRISASVVAVGTGAVGNAAGTIRASTFAVSSAASIDGLLSLFTNGVGIEAASAPIMAWYSAEKIAYVRSDGLIGWSSETTLATGTRDTAFSRLAAASIAIGNGTAGDFTGTLKLTTLIYGSAAVSIGAPTGTGSMVLATTPTFSSAGTTTIAAGGTLTYGGVTLASTVTGTGSMVLATTPTFSSAGTTTIAAGGTLTYGGVTLASIATGTGNLVLSASPTFTGTASFAATTQTGIMTTVSSVAVSSVTSASQVALNFSTTASFGIYFGNSSAPSFAAATGSLFLNTGGSSTSTRLYVKSSAASAWVNFTSAS